MLNKLGKLLKYEFRFYFRILPPLYLATGLLAFLAGLQLNRAGVMLATVDAAIQNTLLTVLWAAIITALIVMNIVMIIQRFTDNLLKNPGSLMFTLPVTSWALTASKAISSLCIVLMTVIVISVSALIYAGNVEGWAVFNNAEIDLGQSIVGIFIMIAFILQQICLFYAVICASHLLPRFRFAAGAVMYFLVMRFAVQPVMGLLTTQDTWFNFIINSVYELIPYGIAALVFAGGFFFATGFLLKTRLNLE